MKIPERFSHPTTALDSSDQEKNPRTNDVSITLSAGIEEKPFVVGKEALGIIKLPLIEPHIMENYILWATGKITFFHRYYVSPCDAVVPQSDHVELYVAAHYLLNEHLQDDMVDLLGHPLRSQKLILQPELIALVWQQTARSFTSDNIMSRPCGLQRLIMETIQIEDSDAGDAFIEACGKDFDRDLRQDLLDLRDGLRRSGDRDAEQFGLCHYHNHEVGGWDPDACPRTNYGAGQ
ncbi:unnamed protein product [Zymoseptoria tritici ST99CH_1A5]|uniref:BTB domain-containing protein n=2 Tax=Zymoseptoria tritici TaxID=1047171 RepID=A0A2H1H4Z8_ZYMTR|nr:unnamed protein product [Zymoseptoria tritici ST99CH_1E4]SMY29367.1 unnamed protein product [Zymoseptoria tritici ST99CH_1A5]